MQAPIETAARTQKAAMPVRRERLRKGELRKRILAYCVLTFFAVIALSPFYYMALLSLDAREGYDAIRWPPNLVPGWRWANYTEALTAQPFGRYFINSGIVTGLSVVGAVLSSAMAGYMFARLRLHYKNGLFIVMLATLMVPNHVTLVPQYILFTKLGWYNTWYPLWVPQWTGVAFAIFLFRQYFKTLPTELEDAAKIDGADPLAIFWRIFLPLSKPVAATVAIIVFVGSWGDLLGPIIYLEDLEKYTLPVGLAYFGVLSGGLTGSTLDVTALMAASVVSVIPPIVLFVLMQGYFVRGVVLTGLKQ